MMMMMMMKFSLKKQKHVAESCKFLKYLIKKNWVRPASLKYPINRETHKEGVLP